MPLNLASPGIKVREVDLTVGRVDPTSDKIGGLVAPLAQGPVDLPILIGSEKDLLDNFGQPYGNDKHYEHWMVASSYLAYGGQLRVVRADDDDLYNAVSAGSSIKIKSIEHYEQLQYDESVITGRPIVAKNPGSWANGLRVAVIDGRADQILTGINTAGVSVFTAAINNRSATIATGAATTIGVSTASITLGQEVRGGFVSTGTTVVNIGTGVITLANATTNTEGGVTVPLDFGAKSFSSAPVTVGTGVTQALSGRVDIGAGTTTALDGHLKGIVTEVGDAQIAVKVLSHVSAAGTEYVKDYQESGTWAFTASGSVGLTTAGQTVSYGTTSYTGQSDWFDQQTLATSTETVGGTVTTQTIPWNTVADRPGTSEYAAERGARFDEVHVVVIDGDGKITGNAGTILEKNLSLSKAKDASFSLGSPSYWRSFLKTNSAYIFGGTEPSGSVATGYTEDFTLETGGSWDQDAEGVIFDSIGKLDSKLTGGKNYDGGTTITDTGALQADLNKLVSGYGLFENTDTYSIDFLVMGSANYSKEQGQALANKLIAVADARKDAIAFISPHRSAFLTDTTAGSVTVNDDDTITDNVISFYSPVTSSSYAVFDSGYKYMFDRFANTFRYIPLKW